VSFSTGLGNVCCFLEELLTASRLTPTTVLIGQPQQADLQLGDLVEVVLEQTLSLSIRWSAFATSARRLVHVRSLGLRPETTT